MKEKNKKQLENVVLLKTGTNPTMKELKDKSRSYRLCKNKFDRITKKYGDTIQDVLVILTFIDEDGQVSYHMDTGSLSGSNVHIDNETILKMKSFLEYRVNDMWRNTD